MNPFRFKPLSITRKQTFVIVATSVVSLVLACASFMMCDRVMVRKAMFRNLHALANVLGNNSTGALDFNDATVATEILSALKAEPHITRACLYNKAGKIFAVYPEFRMPHEFPLLPLTMPGESYDGMRLSLIHPIVQQQETMGTIYLESDLAELSQRVRQFGFLTLLVLFLAVVVAFLMSVWLQRLISEPIIRLVNAIQEVAGKKDYTVRVPKENEDELGVLTDNFNEMLAQVEVRDKALVKAHQELEQRVIQRTGELQAEVAERMRIEQALVNSSAKLQRVNACLLNLSDNHDANINRLTALCGEILDASAALYNHIQGDALCTIDHWHLPPGFKLRDKAEGHLCTSVIDENSDHVFLLTNLPASPFAVSDPNVMQYGIKTYMGHVVRSEGQVLGSLSVVYLDNRTPSEDEQRLLGIIASAIGNEDKRKQSEEQFRQSQKMEAVGQLAGGVAHDFNNILASTMLQLNLLQEEPLLSPKLSLALKELEHDAERAADLTRQLLMFSQRQSIKMTTLDLNRVQADLHKMLCRILGEHIKLVFQPFVNPLWIEADAGKIQQVVMNLCVNARDAMPTGGTLTITLTPVHLDDTTGHVHPDARPGSFVCLSVTDTGSGMDEYVLKRIFEPFFTTKGIGRGTGLGLSTVYGIVRQHHGWIEVSSEVNKGSEFKVYFPTLNVAPEAPGEVRPTILHHGKGTILLVEDDPVVRKLAVQSLRYLGYHVYESCNSAEALQMWAEHTQEIDLLFTDMIMPGSMNGLELAVSLKQVSPTLKVIISSGYSLENNRLDVTWEQEITYLPKPYNVGLLASVVRKCLEL